MNKVSLLTLAKKLSDGNSYVISIYDLEPSGLIVSAYDQTNSKEYTLPISEQELARADVFRTGVGLTELIETIEIVPYGKEKCLQSSNEHIQKAKLRLLGADLVDFVKSPIPGSTSSLNEVLVEGLVELCKVKPVGTDAVKWLGGWLIENNPNKPVVSE